MSNLVSVIVPVFNGERYLREALESIFAQTHPAAEVIVVDDGSEDQSANLAESFGERVTCLRMEHGGLAATRNVGVRSARGDLIAFLDCDDLWVADKLRRQVADLQARPDVEISLVRGRNFVDARVPAAVRARIDGQCLRPMDSYVPGSMLARRDVFARVGPFDTRWRFGDHTDWFFRAAEQGIEMAVLPEVLLLRRLHGANRSTRGAAESRSMHLQIVKAHLDRLRGRGRDCRGEAAAPASPGLPRD